MILQSGKIYFFILLCILTVCTNVWVERYQDAGSQLLLNPEFASGLKYWQVKQDLPLAAIQADNGVLRIQSESSKAGVQIWQQVEMGLKGKKVRLRATLKTEDVHGNGKRWSRARLILVQPHVWQEGYLFYYVLANLTGTNDWREYSKVLTLSSESSMCQFRIQLPRCTGILSVKDVSLVQVTERRIYVMTKWLFISLWGLFILLLFAPVLREKRLKSPLLIGIVLGTIVIGTAMPGSVKNYLKAALLAQLDAGFFAVKKVLWKLGYAGNFVLPDIDITKVAHFLLFGLLTILLLYANSGRSKLRLLGDVLMLACATELIQLYIDGRSPLFGDVLIDMAGGLSALGIWFLFFQPHSREFVLKKD